MRLKGWLLGKDNKYYYCIYELKNNKIVKKLKCLDEVEINE